MTIVSRPTSKYRESTYVAAVTDLVGGRYLLSLSGSPPPSLLRSNSGAVSTAIRRMFGYGEPIIPN